MENNAKVALNEAMDTAALLPAVAREIVQDDYRVNLPNFEGPLDLLLHLIRKDQLNIYDIPISRICKSYLDHIEHMLEPDVNLAGEFMVMAATLTHLKSIMILPHEQIVGTEDDPRMPLVAQLLEYDRFKRAADQLDKVPWLNRDLYPRPEGAVGDIPVESLIDAPVEAIDTFQMLLCLRIALDRTERPPMQITGDPISLKEKVTEMSVLLSEHEVISFEALLPVARKAKDIIVAFLAMLELARLKFVEIIQTENLGPIQIRAIRPLRELNAGLLDQY